MDLFETGIYETDASPKKQALLLGPYNISFQFGNNLTIETGRFSHGLLNSIRVRVEERDQCVLRAGAFCEISGDAVILVGLNHRNESLLNYSFSGLGQFFTMFMSPEDKLLCSVGPTKPTEIADNVVISTGAVIMSGSQIEKGAVIGAGAVVTSRCDRYGIYGGVPAKLLRSRFSPEMAALYEATRLPEIMAHHLPKVPRLLRQLETGEIDIEHYYSSLSFLPVRPTVHMTSEITPEGTVKILQTAGYSLGLEFLTDRSTVEKLDAYFAQFFSCTRLKWTPDIFHTLGVY